MANKSKSRRDHSITEKHEIIKLIWKHNPEDVEWMKTVEKAEKYLTNMLVHVVLQFELKYFWYMQQKG